MKKHRDIQKADARKQQVLEAASRCFAREGFHKTNMPKLAQEAGMSNGNIYGYFPSKNAIIIALVENIVAGIKKQLLGLAATSGNSIDIVRTLIRSHIQQRFSPDNCALSAEVIAETYRNEVVATAMRSLDADIRRMLVELSLKDHPQWPTETARNKVDLLILAIYGYAKSKALCPSLGEEETLASLEALVVYLFES
jgi:AcrR family transcriptional regulator